MTYINKSFKEVSLLFEENVGSGMTKDVVCFKKRRCRLLHQEMHFVFPIKMITSTVNKKKTGLLIRRHVNNK